MRNVVIFGAYIAFWIVMFIWGYWYLWQTINNPGPTMPPPAPTKTRTRRFHAVGANIMYRCERCGALAIPGPSKREDGTFSPPRLLRRSQVTHTPKEPPMRKYLPVTIYAACIPLANYAITHWGQVSFPGGPHTIPVGFGYAAPSGVLFIGLALTARDWVQVNIGKRTVMAAILVGVALSYLTSTRNVATASAIAFGASEIADFAVFTPLAERGRVILAMLASNIVGLLIDTFLFLRIAFGSIAFWQGNVLGKTWMTVAAIPAMLWIRRDVSRHATK